MSIKRLHGNVGLIRKMPKIFQIISIYTLKLFLKERTLPSHRNKAPYVAAPIFSLILALLLWSLYLSPSPIYFITFGLLFFFALSRIRVYGTLVSG